MSMEMIRAFRYPAFPYMKAVELIKCNKCDKEKYREEFYWKKNGKIDRNTCKKCICVSRKAYEQSEVGKAKRKVYEQSEARKARAQTEAGKAMRKVYRESEAGKAKRKAYKQSEAGKASQKAYKQSEVCKASDAIYKLRRHSLLASEPNTLTKDEWIQTLKNQSNCCNGCGVSFEKETACEDHIIPLGEGPGRTKENIQALCNSCNSIKGTRTMEFLIKRIMENETN